MTYKVIDNFLPPDYFNQIHDLVMGSKFPWGKEHGIATSDTSKSDFYFCHMAYNHDAPKSVLYEVLLEMQRMLFVNSCIRIKANMYPRTQELVIHEPHTDYPFEHKGAILFVNSNDGYTIVENKKIESVANRVLFFDPTQLHSSTSCTNQKARMTINFNYV